MDTNSTQLEQRNTLLFPLPKPLVKKLLRNVVEFSRRELRNTTLPPPPLLPLRLVTAFTSRADQSSRFVDFVFCLQFCKILTYRWDGLFVNKIQAIKHFDFNNFVKKPIKNVVLIPLSRPPQCLCPTEATAGTWRNQWHCQENSQRPSTQHVTRPLLPVKRTAR